VIAAGSEEVSPNPERHLGTMDITVDPTSARTSRRDDTAWLLPILALAVPKNVLESLADSAGDLWEAAVDSGYLTDDELLQLIANKSGLPVVRGRELPTSRFALPEKLARRYGVVALERSANALHVATSSPFDLDCDRTLAFWAGKPVRFVVATPRTIERWIERTYGVAGRQPRTSDDQPVVRLVDRIISRGITERASDIHLEPAEDGIAVRYRVDGILREVMLLPRAVGLPLVSRLKIMAGMDISDRLRPQGGHATTIADGVAIDLRVSSLPASHGEKVVIRILDTRSAVKSLEELGLDPPDSVRMKKLLETREGLVLVTGPTGSGKTTTLYAALREIQRRGLNIITVEDPVEYRIPGIVQVQTNDKAGLTFASALRSILRQDPDVVLVGEIRDRETAAIGIQAALTGHLVLATLHTNDACGSITRLADLGVENVKLAAALKGVVAQRLIRRLCPDCRVVANDGAPEKLRCSVAGDLMVYAPVGCDRCSMTGYRGRVAVTEFVLAGAELERAIAAESPSEVLASIARRNGSRSLWECGLSRLTAGETSGDELLRVLEQDTAPDIVVTEPRAEKPVQFDSDDDPANASHAQCLTKIVAGVVDVYVIRPLPEGWKILVLQRADDTRCPSAWETVHGHLDDDERPEDGARRELREETGLELTRLYNVTVIPFYLHSFGAVQLAICFAAFVAEPAEVSLGPEHQKYEWLSPDEAADRFVWPRERESLDHIKRLLSKGDAGAVEDVLRVF
jgi:type II secretory ATPase GspE/PulE/Tfp pilus assembly ATPase PilB-like protein/8-oxo-dGTP pyrophosphatase MutT (NUDIX family)